MSWLIISLMFSAGLVVGLLLGYWPLRSSQNNMQEQYLVAQQQSVSAPAPADPHAPAHKGKAK